MNATCKHINSKMFSADKNSFIFIWFGIKSSKRKLHLFVRDLHPEKSIRSVVPFSYIFNDAINILRIYLNGDTKIQKLERFI